MISIEKDKDAKERFEYNKPFGCIKIEYGDSYDVLPKLPWSKKSIVWLDYDSPLEKTILDDIDIVRKRKSLIINRFLTFVMLTVLAC
ncbi:hypothetical protein H6F96_21960 [Microcoleus sp. FACHB-53]|nr:hypothetical protein [Microcoleus sp. FACHB-53]